MVATSNKKAINKRIRVLQVMDKCAIRGSPIHGVTRLLLGWMPEFINTNVEVSLCVLRSEEGCNGFHDYGIRVDTLNRGKLDPRTVLDLVKIIKRDKIQILHCHGYGASTFGRVTGFITGKPVIIHEHMIDDSMPLYQKLVDRILAPLTAKGVAISNAVKVFMTGPRAIPDQRVQVIYNSVPNEYCMRFSEQQKDAVAKRYGMPREKYIVGIVGRLDPLKGHADFLQSAARVLTTIPKTCFVVVGDGELRKPLEKLTQELGIEDSVLFLGHCQDVLEIISLFDLLVASSHSEGFSLAIAEAMAQGKAIVATEVGGIPEVIENGNNGILVPVKSPDQLARQITKVLRDKDLRDRLGANGLQQCRERFMVSGTIESLQKLYVGLLN